MRLLLHLSSFLLFLFLCVTGSVAFAQSASFTMSTHSVCANGVPVSFTGSPSGATSYAWSFGNGATSSLQSPSTTYSAPGRYYITLTVVSAAGTSSATDSIDVYSGPSAQNFTAVPTSGCRSLTVQLSANVNPNAPGGLTYHYDFGDGNTSTPATSASGTFVVTHTYAVAGTFSVTLYTTNSIGCDSNYARSSYITVYDLPIPSFTSSAYLSCGKPANITFSSTSSGSAPLSYTWSFGDGSSNVTTTSTSISHIYTGAAVFSVALTVKDAHQCSSIVATNITVTDTTASFSSPAQSCKDADVPFANTTSGSSPGAIWNFGDGSVGTGPTITHAYHTAGTYTVKMTVNIGGCNGSTTKSIIINPKPTPTISQSPSVPCPAPSTVSFIANSPLATTWHWDFGNGSTATTQTASATYTANGHYPVTLITTSTAGCKDSVLLDTLVIRNIIGLISPDPSPNPYVAGCAPLTVAFSENLVTNWDQHNVMPFSIPTLYVFGASTWSWDFGDGSAPSTSATPTHVFTNVGTYNVRVINTTPNGCVDTGYRQVHADSTLVPSFYATPTTVCPNTPVTFINTTANWKPGFVFTWNVDGASIPRTDTSRLMFSYKLPGVKQITLVVGHNGCDTSVTKLNYINVTPSGAVFTDSGYCSPSLKVKFKNLSAQATSQLWIFGDGTTDTTYSPVHTYPDTGSYKVKLISYNSLYGCSDTARDSIRIARPKINFVLSDSTRCVGQITTVQGYFNGAGQPYYSYIFGNFQTGFDSLSSTFYQWNTRGLYDVALVVSSGSGCLDTVRKKNAVLVSGPQVKFGSNAQIGCLPFTVTFTDSSTNTPGVPNKYRFWSFGQGVRDTLRTTLPTVNRTYPNRGFYSVMLTVTDSLGCTDSSSGTFSGVSGPPFTYIIEVRKPTAKFSASIDTTCVHSLIQFTDSSTGATMPLAHMWSFGNGDTSSLASPAYSYAAPGAYTVRLIVTDSTGCKDTAVYPRPIIIRGPHAAFASSKHIAVCPPLQVSFTNNSTGGISYLWNFGNGSTPIPTNTLNTVSSTYTHAGIYQTYLVAYDQYQCKDTARDTVRVLGYAGAFTYAPITGCAPLTVQFYTSVGDSIPRLTWDFRDGTTAVQNYSHSISHTYTAPGPYLPVLYFSDGTPGCNVPSVGLDTIKVDELTAHFRWNVPCAGTPFMLYDSSYARYNAPLGITWSFGAGDTASGTPVTHTYTQSGNHSVTITVHNAAGCTATETRNVFINPLPLVDAGPDSVGVCPRDTARLTFDTTTFIASGALSYVWSPANYLSCTACDTTYTTHTPGKFYVVGTDANGCVNKDSISTFIQIKTESNVSTAGEICAGDSVRLHASGATSYIWTPVQYLDSPRIANPLATPPLTTVFVLLAQKGSCLIDTEHVTVIVHPHPYFDAGPDEELRLGSAVVLQSKGVGYKSIAWQKDSTLSCLDCLHPTASPLFTTVYIATFTDVYGCVSTDSVTVRVHCNSSLTFIPNTFTPNGDGQNDVFYPRGEGIHRIIHFRIFNRWGQVVFDRMNVALNDPKSGWDGTFNGQALPPDTYYYTMDTHCDTGEPVSWKGDITLVR